MRDVFFSIKKVVRVCFLAITLIVMLGGCADTTETSEEIIFLERSEIALVPQDIVGDYKLIPLEITDHSILRGVNKIVKVNSFYFVFDRRTKMICKYDEQGRFLGKIHRVGEGPNEYVEIKDFYVYDNQLVLLTYPFKLIFIDINSLIPAQDEFILPDLYSQVVVKGDYYYIYSGDSGLLDIWHSKDRQLVRTYQFDVLKGLIPYDESMYVYDEQIYMHIPGDDVIYSINELELKKISRIDYPNRNSIIDFYSNRDTKPLELEEIGIYSLPSISNIFKLKNEFYFMYSFMGAFQTNLPDRNNKGSRVNCCLTAAMPLNPSVVFTDKDRLISWGYLFQLQKMPVEKTVIDSRKIDEIVSEDIESIVLIEYILK